MFPSTSQRYTPSAAFASMTPVAGVITSSRFVSMKSSSVPTESLSEIRSIAWPCTSCGSFALEKRSAAVSASRIPSSAVSFTQLARERTRPTRRSPTTSFRSTLPSTLTSSQPLP